ncbi:MAG: isopenicillin N synthase family oxygenase [Alphaproteobacteria bacterium]|nr:isopenicillin N synthase family oxygenase [Alphaproteobacteria bacterium]
MRELELPVFDVRALDGPTPDAARGLLDPLERWGFVALQGHGLDPALLAEAYAAAASFFAQPTAVKRAWERPELGRQRGYTGFGVEHARDQGVHDLKEFWQVGRTLGAEHPLVASGLMPDDLVPATPPDFGPAVRALYEALDALSQRLLGALARGLGLDAPALQEAVRDGNSVLRVIHYPPTRASDPDGAVRAAAHEDINLLTLLPASTQPGLQLLDRDGTWRALVTPPDVVICDTGDLMQVLTGGRLPATTHRVVNPPGGANVSRYSLPFFAHPRPDWVLPVDPPVTAGALLRRRLEENRVL